MKRFTEKRLGNDVQLDFESRKRVSAVKSSSVFNKSKVRRLEMNIAKKRSFW